MSIAPRILLHRDSYRLALSEMAGAVAVYLCSSSPETYADVLATAVVRGNIAAGGVGFFDTGSALETRLTLSGALEFVKAGDGKFAAIVGPDSKLLAVVPVSTLSVPNAGAVPTAGVMRVTARREVVFGLTGEGALQALTGVAAARVAPVFGAPASPLAVNAGPVDVAVGFPAATAPGGGALPRAVSYYVVLPAAGTVTRANGAAVGEGEALTAAEFTGLRYKLATLPAEALGVRLVGYTTHDGVTTLTSRVLNLAARPVVGSNRAPVAAADTASTAFETPVSIPVLANDTDPDGDTLSIGLVSSPGNGTASASVDGQSVTYTPATGFEGVDSFSYLALDGRGGSMQATVSVTVAASIAQRQLAAPVNSTATVGFVASGTPDAAITVTPELTAGTLQKQIPGTAGTATAATYELAAIPDAGAGALAAGLGAITAQGTTPVYTLIDDAGNPATGAAVTGVQFGTGTPLGTPTITAVPDTTNGFAFEIDVVRTTASSTAIWASFGRFSSYSRGFTVNETSGGTLRLNLYPPGGGTTITVDAAGVVPLNTRTKIKWVWEPTAGGIVRTYVNGVEKAQTPAVLGSGGTAAPIDLTGGARFGLGAGVPSSGNFSGSFVPPNGRVYSAKFEAGTQGTAATWANITAATDLTRAEAESLRVSTVGTTAYVEAAGRIKFRYTVGGKGKGEDALLTVGTPADAPAGGGSGGGSLPAPSGVSYVSGEMSFAPVELGGATGDVVTLVSGPAKGKIRTGFSGDYIDPGETIGISVSGIPAKRDFFIQPKTSQNPGGSITRGWVGTVTANGVAGAQKTVEIREMNRAPKLNGGGEVWGHADDVCVPFVCLSYQYGTGEFPKIDSDSLVVTVLEVPVEGEIRVERSGAKLTPGATVAAGDVRKLVWWKPGVTAVGANSRLRLEVKTSGSPISVEDYYVRMTDAARPAVLRRWCGATYIYADEHTALRWAARGGDWAGTDGLYGVTPFVKSAAITAAGQAVIDVTAYAKANGADFFMRPANAAVSFSFYPKGYTTNPALQPVLRVTGGGAAGDYQASRFAPLFISDTTGWARTYTAGTRCKVTEPTLLAFDGLPSLADATKIELVLNVSSVSGGGGALDIFKPSPQVPRPSARVAYPATAITARADFVAKVDTDAEWLAMINNASAKQKRGAGQPGAYPAAGGYTIANGCYYGSVAQGENTGLSLLLGFWKADGTGYGTIRTARMVGWHDNYRPLDANCASDTPGVSGKSPGPMASLDIDLSEIESGRGGNAISGRSMYTCRMQRGLYYTNPHPTAEPLSQMLAFGDYNYFMSGNTNGLTTYAVNPIPRMKWAWIETVHKTNTVNPDGTWQNDGVFELYINGRKQCESRRLEYRVPSSSALWDAFWFDEYQGGTEVNVADRVWPFVVGPTYIVSGDTPIPPPANWNVPFVGPDGRPAATPTAYAADW